MARSGRIGESGFGRQILPLSAGAKISKHSVRLFDGRSWGMSGRYMASRHEQVLPAVVVEVVESGPETRHSKALSSHAAHCSDFSKISLARVLKQGKGLLVQGDIGNARIAIISEVAKIQAHAGDECAFLWERGIGLKGNFFELVAKIVKQEVVFRVIGHEQV